MKYWVRTVDYKWSKSVEDELKQWHLLRLQPLTKIAFKLEKKVFNAAQVATRRSKIKKKPKEDPKEEYSVVWLASETHPRGYATSPVFASIERLVHRLCVALRVLNYEAEPAHDDTNYVCHISSKESVSQPITRIGIRISNLENGDRNGALRLYRSKKLVSVLAPQSTPRLVKK